MNYGLCTKVRIAAPVGSLDALQAVSAAVELQSAMYFTGGQFSTLQQPLVGAANATAADALTAAVTMFQSATMYWAHPATTLPPLALSTQGNALERVRKKVILATDACRANPVRACSTKLASSCLLC
eukprot:2161-Heterococcus_DN1.PRE.1